MHQNQSAPMEVDSSSVIEFIRRELPDWDDEVIATARFKAFSGQRSDWEPKYRFWRDLILQIARHFHILMVRPRQVKNEWFNRGGLTPLCLDHVLTLMYNEGDIVPISSLVDPRSWRVSQLFRKVRNLMVRTTVNVDIMLEDHVILVALVKDRATEIVNLLSESHWTTACIVTMNKFRVMCGGQNEASAVLSYLTGHGKARCLSSITSKKEPIEGIKVSLSPEAVAQVSSLDCDVLHLIWTAEKLQQQISVIDQRHELSKKLALASLKSGNKKLALRHAREMKLGSVSAEKCVSLLHRVEEILDVIANAESTKKVSEAMQLGARVMKENKLTVEEVELCLEQVEETIHSQLQVDKALESTPSYMGIDDDDIEEELEKLEEDISRESLNRQVVKAEVGSPAVAVDAAEATDPLSDAMSNLKLEAEESVKQGSQSAALEAA
ncbi:Charged multivesicular body protein 7 [Linum grandiflorum]